MASATAAPSDQRVEGLIREDEFRWVVARHGAMRVPGVVFASEALLPAASGDRSILQVINVATLPGIVRASYAMPDIHWGYGFPIGGVAATDVSAGGVVSPGGVGFDISCGVRLLRTPLQADEVKPQLGALMHELARTVPVGTGGGGIWRLDTRADIDRVLHRGAAAAIAAGYGTDEDLTHCEDQGGLPVETTASVSDRAIERGLPQLGSLGSGNHFLEVQQVEQVFDADVARRFGLTAGQVTVMIHTGSRGLGHQVCSDHVRAMVKALPGYGIVLPDQQLAAAPVDSPHGHAYLNAMAASANYGRANRQVIAWGVRRSFQRVLDCADLPLVYDVSHNLAKLERHTVDGRNRMLCVHRKGATRALPPGHPDLPTDYVDVGQPVLIPGSMGTASYVLVGTRSSETFYSTCHGAGRVMSRHQAMKTVGGRALAARLKNEGILVLARAIQSLPEETPEAYKDIDEVVRVCEGAGLSRAVARLTPLGVLKG
ncbi:MAG TPA: RtcB family protein [Candidatus Limnocylindrales bacterium]|nr:RtcB family protein [Candidatus Limnocylindrales bacterium]